MVWTVAPVPSDAHLLGSDTYPALRGSLHLCPFHRVRTKSRDYIGRPTNQSALVETLSALFYFCAHVSWHQRLHLAQTVPRTVVAVQRDVVCPFHNSFTTAYCEDSPPPNGNTAAPNIFVQEQSISETPHPS